jgi:general secretion pathway protein B
MSLILDALKKLDREKSSRRNGMSNIAVEILRPDPTRPAKGIPIYLLVVALTAAVTAAITFAVVEFRFLSKPSPPAPLHRPSMSQGSASDPLHSVKSSSSEPVQSSAPGQPDGPAPQNSGFQAKSSPPPAPSPPAPSQQVVPAPVSHEPIHETRDEINRVPPKSETRAESKTAPTLTGEKETSQNVIVERANVAPGNTEQPPEPTPTGSATTPPSLKLSAIVWHDEPSKRIAVINGTITTEQSVIEGVKIEVIYPNRVRLSHNGRPFEILLK